MVLHVELIENVKEADRPLCGIKYGESISRDILVPFNLPLHNLHYVINQAFGFTNSHLHEFTLPHSLHLTLNISNFITPDSVLMLRL